MKCPRCETTTLQEQDRNDLTIDRCPECRGVWLDRGELEKLVARAQRELETAPARDAGAADSPARSASDSRQPRDWDDDGDDDDDFRRRENQGDRERSGDGRQRRRGGFLENLSDLFGGD